MRILDQKKWIKNEKIEKVLTSSKFISIAINVLFLLLILVFCDQKYETSDDFVMSTIMSGAYSNGEPNPHLIFINVIVGYILLPFYYWFPEISWYFVFQMALLLCAFILMTYLLIEKNGKAIGVMLTIMMLTLIGDDAYILVQFTKTAVVVSMCGALVFLWALFYERRICLVVLSGMLCLTGTLLRFKSIYIIGVFLLLLLFTEFWKLFRDSARKPRLKRTAYIMVCGGILIGSSYICQFVDAEEYNKTDVYEQFRKFSSIRSSVVDSSDYGYDAYREELEKIGVSENDYWLLRRWNFSDDEVFSEEILKKVGNILDDYDAEKAVALGDIYEQMQSRKILNYPSVIACICLMILSFVFLKMRWLGVGASIVIAILLEVYFFQTGRVVYRIEYSIFASAFLAGCFFGDKSFFRFEKNSNESKKIAILISAALFLWETPLFAENSAYQGVTDEGRKAYLDEVFYDSWSYDARKYRRVVNKDKPECGLIKEIEENKDNFYFLDFRTTIQTLYYEWSPWETVNSHFYENSLYFGGVTSKFPGVDEIAAAHGIDNYFQDLVNDNVYIVDNENVDARLKYLQEHYYPNARAELYKEVSGYQIWKFYEK